MLTIRWTEDCETGVALVDEQHKHLIDVMNRLAKAIDQKKTTETTDADKNLWESKK
jgi:hemerythrin